MAAEEGIAMQHASFEDTRRFFREGDLLQEYRLRLPSRETACPSTVYIATGYSCQKQGNIFAHDTQHHDATIHKVARSKIIHHITTYYNTAQ